MVNKRRVAIFSVSIPSTTFIDNLITGLAGKNLDLFVLGRIEGKINYPTHVRVLRTFKNDFYTFINVIKHSLLLLFSRPVILFRLWKNVLKKNSFRGTVFKLGFYLPLVREKIQLLHIQWATHLSAFEELMDNTDIRVILSFRGSLINSAPLINNAIANSYKKLFPKCYRFHSVSGSMIPIAVKFGADERKISVIYTSLNNAMENAILKRGSLHTPLELLAVGRFDWTKGYEYLIDSLASLKKQNFNVRFTLVASGEVPDHIKLQIIQLELSEYLTVINGLPHHQVIDRIRSSDILVVSSVVEGIANVALEAMAVGTIVITTDCGGMNELVNDNENGFIVPIRNTAALTEKIKAVAGFPVAELETIREKAKNTIMTKFTRQRMIDEFEKLYF
jgi:glycosyltransferase involved in cell wall biosynthesis